MKRVDHDRNEDDAFADNDRGYDGTSAPVQIEDIVHEHGAAVISGALQCNGHVIHAEAAGVIVVDDGQQPRGGASSNRGTKVYAERRARLR